MDDFPGPGWPDFPGDHWGGPLGVIWRAMRAIAMVVGWTFGVVVAAVVIVLLIRFLWVATKAARRYLDLHPAPGPDAGQARSGPAPSGPAPSGGSGGRASTGRAQGGGRSSGRPAGGASRPRS